MSYTKSPILAIWVSGNELSEDIIRRVISLTITQRENKATDGTAVFSDNDFLLSDMNVFKKGRRLGFLFGWTDESNFFGPFTVKSYTFNAGIDGSPTLNVRFQDLSHKMNKKQKSRKHVGKPVDIIKKIADEHNLGYDIESMNDLLFDDNRPLVQTNMTDARLLQKLATRYGYVWGVDGTTLYFRRPNDLDYIGKQKEVPVLSYRINGATLMAFDAEVKFIDKAQKKGSNQKEEGIDLLSDFDLEKAGEITIDSARELASDALPALKKIVGIEDGQEAGDEEKGIDEKKEGPKIRFDDIRGIWKKVGGKLSDIWKDDDEEIEEINSGDTAADEEEMKRRAAAKILGTTELIEASFSPRIASTQYRPGQAVILAGIGERYSGKYHVKEVTHSFGEESFATSLRAIKRSFKAAPEIKNKIAEGSGQESLPGNQSSADGQPSKNVYRVTIFDDVKGTWKTVERVKKVDGADDV